MSDSWSEARNEKLNLDVLSHQKVRKLSKNTTDIPKTLEVNLKKPKLELHEHQNE